MLTSYSFFTIILVLCAIEIILLLSAATTSTTSTTDELALLAFRDKITDNPLGALSNWNTTVDVCKWEGITCTKLKAPNRIQTRVTAINLQSRKLVGSFSPHLRNLTYLQQLNLGDNFFHGIIPPELGSLLYLRLLNLTLNSLGGSIPANLSECKHLKYVDLTFNQLVGDIPTSLTSLSSLDYLVLNTNNLTGNIPSSIGNLSSLTELTLGRNNLVGSIPDSIGLLRQLDFLQIAENQLSGTIPPSLYNLSSLKFLAIATNQIHGSLAPTLGLTLPKLDTLYVGGNHLSGPIPASITNASRLINLDFGVNNFTGSVPVDLGKLGGLEWLNFEGNQLGTRGDANSNELDFITSLNNCTNLELLDIDSNQFGGMLPNSVANLSTQLSMLIMSGNQIYGSIPESICQLAGLTLLRLEKNLLTSRVPSTIGRLQNLQILSLFHNRLSGQIPPSLGNLTELNDLRLMDNDIQGSIPPTLGNCTKLQFLDLSQNKLNGTVPKEVISIPSLSIHLSLSHNSLVGSLPREIVNMKNLGELDLSENRLSGQIPGELGDCESLIYLHMQDNLFSGSIPTTLSKLKGLEYLDLSHNNLSGQIPKFLEKLHSLRYLNLSFNDFEGVVPKEGVFKNVSAVSVEGNAKLCGGVPLLQLPSCIDDGSSNKRSKPMRIIVLIICALLGTSLLLCFFATLYWQRNRKRRQPATSSLGRCHIAVSYKELVKATNSFAASNLIGEGSFGTVYKGTLERNGADVAVKVLNLQNQKASQSFIAECETLREIRHRNLIKILTLCSSVDSTGNDFKAIVYEFMPNGGLDEWLHPNEAEEKQHRFKVLNILQWMNISTDVADALDYLHHQCLFPIVHCDLKPSNVLLDESMTAHVSDFGLAKILINNEVSSHLGTSSIGIKGSIGYIPPEYGVGGEVSAPGDVYSYGILILEMFTGKRPTDDTLNDGSNLRDYVKTAYPENIMEVMDPQLSLQVIETEGAVGINNEKLSKIKGCLALVMGVGLSCSATSPRKRMQMREVATRMHDIKASLLSFL